LKNSYTLGIRWYYFTWSYTLAHMGREAPTYELNEANTAATVQRILNLISSLNQFQDTIQQQCHFMVVRNMWKEKTMIKPTKEHSLFYAIKLKLIECAYHARI